MKKTKFKIREFITLLTSSSFLFSLGSGVIVFLIRKGRIDTSLWGLNKYFWGTLHLKSSFILVLGSISYFYYHRKVLIRHFKQMSRQIAQRKAELSVIVILFLLIVFSSVFHIGPPGTKPCPFTGTSCSECIPAASDTTVGNWQQPSLNLTQHSSKCATCPHSGRCSVNKPPTKSKEWVALDDLPKLD